MYALCAWCCGRVPSDVAFNTQTKLAARTCLFANPKISLVQPTAITPFAYAQCLYDAQCVAFAEAATKEVVMNTDWTSNAPPSTRHIWSVFVCEVGVPPSSFMWPWHVWKRRLPRSDGLLNACTMLNAMLSPATKEVVMNTTRRQMPLHPQGIFGVSRWVCQPPLAMWPWHVWKRRLPR